MRIRLLSVDEWVKVRSTELWRAGRNGAAVQQVLLQDCKPCSAGRRGLLHCNSDVAAPAQRKLLAYSAASKEPLLQGVRGRKDCVSAEPEQRCPEILRYVLLVNGRKCVLRSLALHCCVATTAV